ncbi:MAG: ADP-ribosylation factor-like protein [Promethearchaeota archaeon]
MSNSSKGTFDYLVERFFKDGVAVKDYKDILKKDLGSLKNVGGKVIKLLKNLSIENIKDLIQADVGEIERQLIKEDFPEVDRDALIIMIKILTKLLGSKSREKVEKISKVAVMGIQNAGKTSFINFISGTSPSEKLKGTEPTVSVEHRSFNIEGIDLSVWDFGGQVSFREEYLKNPEEFFLNTDLLLYLVDTQDDGVYADSIDYFNSILEILTKTGVKLNILIDFHKMDPDISQDIDFVVKSQWLEEKFRDVLVKYNFPFEFMRSSIFEGVTSENEPEIAKNLKELFISKSSSIGQPSELDLLKNILYVQTKTYLSLMGGVQELMVNIKKLEHGLLNIGEQGSVPPPAAPASAKAAGEAIPGFSKPRIIPPPIDPRISIVKELKDAFKRKAKLL